MTEFPRLDGGAVGGDSELTKDTGAAFGGKGENIGGVICGPKLSVETAELTIVGDEAVEPTAVGDTIAQSPGEVLQRAAA
jgi:hypothetical protein